MELRELLELHRATDPSEELAVFGNNEYVIKDFH